MKKMKKGAYKNMIKSSKLKKYAMGGNVRGDDDETPPPSSSQSKSKTPTSTVEKFNKQAAQHKNFSRRSDESLIAGIDISPEGEPFYEDVGQLKNDGSQHSKKTKIGQEWISARGQYKVDSENLARKYSNAKTEEERNKWKKEYDNLVKSNDKYKYFHAHSNAFDKSLENFKILKDTEKVKEIQKEKNKGKAVEV